MRRLTYFGPSAALLFLASGAFAAPETATQVSSNQAQAAAPAAQSEAPVAGEKRICKRLPITGTRNLKATCLTEKEWKQVEDDMDQ